MRFTNESISGIFWMGSRNSNRGRHKKIHKIEDVIEDPTVIEQLVKELGPVAQKEGEHNLDEVISARTLRTIPVCWGIPFDEISYSKWVQSMLIHNRPMPWDDFMVTTSTYLPEARNDIHQDYITRTGDEWLMMLDSDVSPPPRIVDSLLAHTKDPEVLMVGGWYRKKAEPYNPVVYQELGIDEDDKFGYRIYEEDDKGTGLEQVDAAGAGCWLIHRSVAEAIGERPYDMEHGGEDLKLCRKVTDAGFKIWIDWDLACAHIGVGNA